MYKNIFFKRKPLLKKKRFFNAGKLLYLLNLKFDCNKINKQVE